MASLNKQYFSFLILMISFLLSRESKAQKMDTISTFSITAYVDAYYARYTDSVGPGNFQKFPDASPRSNSPSLNVASINAQYNADKIRAVIALNFGDIAQAIFPHPYNNILEAHAGYKIYRKLWIDAGFFRPHFGTEYVLPVENIATSVAVGTAYEPAYESGIKLNFDPTAKLEINLFLLNGYNMYVDNNNKKSFGMGITYALGDKGGIGYTNYIGDDTPPGAPTAHLRFAQNVYINYQYKKIKVQVGGDFYIQQNSKLTAENKSATMYSALATVKYQWNNRFAIYGRVEVFHDPDGFVSAIIVDSNRAETGYKLWGATAGLEYKPTQESYVRLENRYIQMDKDEDIFNTNGLYRNYRYEVMIDAGVTFDLLKNVMTKKTD
jgi:opacity protein-like surface antigen